MPQTTISREEAAAVYSPDCSACLRSLPHTVEQHNATLVRNDEASDAEYPEDREEW